MIIEKVALPPLRTSRGRSHSNSSSPRIDTRRDVSVGSVPVECYVPGTELIPIYDPHRSEEEPIPDMRDMECQTRESLFATNPIDRISDHSLSPPPLPAARIPKSPPNFSTFGYPKPQEEKKFRAEAVIEMKTQDQRPFSLQSTKSAPDVIVTHWHRWYEGGFCTWEPYKRRHPRPRPAESLENVEMVDCALQVEMEATESLSFWGSTENIVAERGDYGGL